mmetsp:Transcript_50158/g.76297  ORF Transcript_50158/g.76297 Transcript_50158/m.76297 type:complete len:91 (+) Transcript_50158:56-328(+)
MHFISLTAEGPRLLRRVVEIDRLLHHAFWVSQLVMLTSSTFVGAEEIGTERDMIEDGESVLPSSSGSGSATAAALPVLDRGKLVSSSSSR